MMFQAERVAVMGKSYLRIWINNLFPLNKELKIMLDCCNLKKNGSVVLCKMRRCKSIYEESESRSGKSKKEITY